MIQDTYAALSVASIVVLLCTASLTDKLRSFAQGITGILECPFCTSWWVGLIVTSIINTEQLWLRVPAIVALANVFILLIHWSMDSTDDN